jgi:hypothetical protein
MFENEQITRQRAILLVGDAVTLALVTAFGFASHNTLGSAGVRLLTTFLPLAAAWLLVAPFLGVFDPKYTLDGRQLWRPFWAMILAAPMAAWLRGVLLDDVIMPLFVIILGGVSALALLAWRSACWLWMRRTTRNNG